MTSLTAVITVIIYMVISLHSMYALVKTYLNKIIFNFSFICNEITYKLSGQTQRNSRCTSENDKVTGC
jgi:hypothetical protein